MAKIKWCHNCTVRNIYIKNNDQNQYQVVCRSCGTTGSRASTLEAAVRLWNQDDYESVPAEQWDEGEVLEVQAHKE